MGLFRSPASRQIDGTNDAFSTGKCGNGSKKIVAIGALVQMTTVALILGGAAVVLVASIFNPRHADPMGIFGLPSVCAVVCRPTSAKNRALRCIETGSQYADREAA
jgi:hypothetical protein